MSRAPRVLGVTGSVGAGKSTVCATLKALGWSVLDLDVVAAEVIASGIPEVQKLLPELGEHPRGAAVLRAILERPALRRQVNSAAHPYVEARIREWRSSLTGDGVLDAALLFEFGFDALCDATWCVTCPIEERRARVATRTTTSRHYFDEIEAAQWTEEQKLRHTDDAVSGSTDGEPLETRVRAALAQWP